MTFQIVVSDSNCLIDLRKASLLEAFLSLPFEVVIPDLMLTNELLSFSEAEIHRLLALGLKPRELDGASITQVSQLNRTIPSLTVYDCMAYVLAQGSPNSILFTGDQRLRTHAESNQVEVHGVLWGIEQMQQHTVASTQLLVLGLQALKADTSVRIPKTELTSLLERLSSALRH